MSDYSPPPSPNAFDELEDVLYDADPAPDLADELASHALHSPLLYAAEFEPGYELQEYYSDWEYYSDDYYDDDPSILKSNPIDGSPTKRARQSSGQAGGARGRKRKMADRDNDVPPLDDDRRYLRDCMKGTVWAQPVARRDNVYRAGQNEKVALLKDWRAKFGTASPKKGQGKAKALAPLSEDEAWANNLSLADMGLMNARGSMAQAQEGDEVEDEGLVDGTEGEEAIDPNDQEMSDEEEDGNDAEREPEPPLPPSSDLPRKSSPLAVRSRQTSPELNTNGTDDQPTKRRKKNAPIPSPVLPSPPATNGSTARRTRSRADSASTTASATTSRTGKQQKPAAAPAPKPTSRKRKASVTDEDAEEGESADSRARGPTTSSRAKRAASSANNVVSSKAKTAQASAPARATRSRKK